MYKPATGSTKHIMSNTNVHGPSSSETKLNQKFSPSSLKGQNFWCSHDLKKVNNRKKALQEKKDTRGAWP